MEIPAGAVQVIIVLQDDRVQVDGSGPKLIPGETAFFELEEGWTDYGLYGGFHAWTLWSDPIAPKWRWMNSTPLMVLGYVMPNDIISAEGRMTAMRAKRVTVIKDLSHDELRSWLPQDDPNVALYFALKVDCGPHDDTRRIASLACAVSLQYALTVDKEPRDDARAQACLVSDYAATYAELVDKCPRDDTRAAACKGLRAALKYAIDVDKGPRDDTRQAVLSNPNYALHYAIGADKCPRDDTRKAACVQTEYAYLYSKHVDKGHHPDTLEAVKGRSRWEGLYLNLQRTLSESEEVK